MNNKKTENTKGTIRSVEQAASLLNALSDAAGPLTLTDLAQSANMPAAKAHRYLTSLINTGLVAQAHRSGAYDLGDFAIQLGLSALSRQNLVNRAADAMEELAQNSKATVLLAVWGDQGPTIIRWERTDNYLATSLGIGSTVPLLTSASGNIFLAYLPNGLLNPVVRKERATARQSGITDKVPMDNMALDKLIARVRARGYANIDGGFIPGLAALSAPVLNIQGEVEVNLTLISTSADQLQPGERAFNCLIDVCQHLSQPPL